MNFVRFSPILKERVWGGRGLAGKLGRTLPGEGAYGESWELVDREEAQSRIIAGPGNGQTFREFLRERTEYVMGSGWESGRAFPILVKWLDCKERLSLQVHPPERVAPELGGEPKTENWYIHESEPGAALIVGLKKGVSREDFEEALENGELEPLLHRVDVSPGDSLFVPSGRLHAIDAGNLILEIQQNSDTTYRVYDWGRTGLDGQPRELHVAESLKSIDWEDTEPEPIHDKPGSQTLVDSEVFRMRKVDLEPGRSLNLQENDGGRQPRLLTLLRGSLSETAGGGDIPLTETVLLPAAEDFQLEPGRDGARVIITDHFAPAE